MTLTIQAERWRTHLERTFASADVVPVAKGNGYGFGLPRLAGEAERLGATTLAVGTADEVAQVRDAFSGDVVVLTPWRAHDTQAVALATDPRVVTTVSREVDLAALVAAEGTPRVLLELRTSMRRHGVEADEARSAVRRLDVGDALGGRPGVVFEGWTIHLPLLTSGRLEEARRLGRLAVGLRRGPLWMSHLSPAEATTLGEELGVPVRLRLGTSLWLGDPAALRTTATVIDVHPVAKGDRIGYRQRRVARAGWVLVLAGGTAHGVGLEAPSAAASLRSRAVAAATGGLEAVGRALSPYTVDGRKRWFLEPPHMQSSMVLLPGDATPPSVGDSVPVELRLTTADVDAVVEV
ncbi:alanine racemase [Auraticoccus sp. F435]|uniref:Alanine racemase n=1 Tax=Auraticoccus cholistanensis TaxID=2656650 RepID=A0A6A9UQ43_9ACTN|nr:alanine racemase [Auraticoccus cholistanensis]MVA74668.1 alanine racemase [Auraticoccus cholistanensis]